MIVLRPWSGLDVSLLFQTFGDSEAMAYQGGVENDESILARHHRYLHRVEVGGMFTIQSDGERVGAIGYWQRQWNEGLVYESGWIVLPEFRRRGIATAAAMQIIDVAKRDGRHSYLHAFATVDNVASNRVCQRLGFTKGEPCSLKYTAGQSLLCNDWQILLR